MQYDDSRIVICMKNIDYECDYGFPLLDLIPKREVTLYSSPDKLDSTLTKSASTLALKKLSKFPQKSYTYYAVYLTLSKQLIITQINVSSKQKKYRSADKLSNAGVLISKIKETKVDEILL